MNDVRYLNTDLLIKSREDLTPIVKSFGEDVFVLSNDKTGEFYYSYFEISGSHAAANEDIEYFCSLIEGLDEKERKIWDNSFYKIFDLGYESGDTTQSYSTDVKPETISRIAKCGASIRITIYPLAPENK